MARAFPLINEVSFVSSDCCRAEVSRTDVLSDASGNQLPSKPRFFDGTKIVGILFGLAMFWVFYNVPGWIDPILDAIVESLGLTMDSSHWLAPTLRGIIAFSWWLFLLMFVIVNSYQVSWAGVGYAMRRKTDSKLGNSTDQQFIPSVAVLIPVHNEEEHIERTLQSVVNQTYPNITQIIIVDDGSTDRTAEIVNEYAERDRRVQYRLHQVNKGKPVALNTGFSLSHAELTFFMDGDSHLELSAIERLVPHFKDPYMGAVASLIAIHNNQKLLAKFQEVEYFFTQLVTRFCQSLEKTVLICPGAGTMVRTEIAKDIHHDDRTITEDADFTFAVHRRWRVSQEPSAVSYTDAMTTLRTLTNQRVRWLYGVLQTINLHRWSIAQIWVLWAWIGYFMSFITLGILLLLPVMVYVFGYGFLVFLVGYLVVAGILVWAIHAAPLLWHPQPSKKLVLLVPIYLIYQQYLNTIQLYCVFRKLTKKGVTVKYGPRLIHAI